MNEEQVKMYESDDSAVYEERTLKGWWSKDGRTRRFWGKDEHMARYAGCTHRTCECGAIVPKGYIRCNDCSEKAAAKRWAEMPLVEWDGKAPVCIHGGDEYFWDDGSFFDWCQDHGCRPESVRLVLCDPVYPSQLDSDFWCDDLPEDGELDDTIQKAVDELNKVLKAHGPMSWHPGTKRVICRG
ncbi:hypothetical protein GO013_06595 [Pseudodesulfovibrio sp. JC047]|uniref:hypothetical protein n=1 Tax=Pseudodesulfovibrio sp. JC047 TaxID=2683199 RepID=UPI0013D748A0|nr:hypothetical protein [Pseudodesulfovibrio sp. JC047]NDV19088.1 hypothetical protein [Pseudodesulfovibrio sp. JC047]